MFTGVSLICTIPVRYVKDVYKSQFVYVDRSSDNKVVQNCLKKEFILDLVFITRVLSGRPNPLFGFAVIETDHDKGRGILSLLEG